MGSSWTIRKAVLEDAMGVAKVHVDSWRTTYSGIVNDEFLASLSYEKCEERLRNRIAKNSNEYAMFVAEDEEGQIIGFADGGRERSGDSTYDGELYAIYLLKEHQRKGVGKLLFRHVVSHLASSHFHTMLIWVLNDNPSRYFYESMGGRLVREQSIQIGEQQLQESAYGWRNLMSLREQL
ncbi:GNAT family N-acetyltransferase [Alicyclobacillus fastidiosus]|uniref:GNAT family N-acetyltransferase n=1 Tax=Alicyclobacillus fastidiosus TaxID=392011 RepID=A0ABY6ZEX3_9BACL|nr:GNAT family N-acetyltransferase [Alicyclobacillus fastidiosus]WAH41453.1 GNAT family N-acetyltransferase [Alicyclobacillus fastidiosus]GMA63086.1 acetyltransferase [Alicyclobacillus fastidiosus]